MTAEAHAELERDLSGDWLATDQFNSLIEYLERPIPSKMNDPADLESSIYNLMLRELQPEEGKSCQFKHNARRAKQIRLLIEHY